MGYPVIQNTFSILSLSIMPKALTLTPIETIQQEFFVIREHKYIVMHFR